MLLIHVEKSTNRVKYILSVIFESILQLSYRITTDRVEFVSYEGAKLSYGKSKISEEVFIASTDFLFSLGLQRQDLHATSQGKDFSFFPTFSNQSDFHFDIFAASFYLVSRYEEYLPHSEDKHNRFNVEDSLTYQHKCLQKPLVNLWAMQLVEKLKARYPDLQVAENKFTFVPTFDIDNAYAYKYRGSFRASLKLGKAFLKGDFTLGINQVRVLCGVQKDPFDTYDFLVQSICKYQLKADVFVLLGKYGMYDKNISPQSKYYQKLIDRLKVHANIGIHPSYASFNKQNVVRKEIETLRTILKEDIIRSRFHFIRFSLPDSYQILIQNSILHDYSMGYTSEYGFRAGICTPFYFYNLVKECETDLLIHPFVIMDGTLNYYQETPLEQVLPIYKEMIDEVRAVGGTFYCIWHNESISNQFQWKGWRKIYEQVNEYAINNE